MEPSIQSARSQPDRDQVGALSALILIAYALIRIVTLPTWQTDLSMLGLIVPVRIDTRVVMLSLAGALAGTGAYWILQSHPLARIRNPGGEVGLMPGLAALGAGAILNQLPVGSAWLVGLLLAGVLLVAVLYAEYVVFDDRDSRSRAGIAGLRSLGVVLIVGVAFATFAADLRAVFGVPAVFAASAIVCWRSLKLELGQAVWPYSLACGLIVAQLAWALHYWPATSIQAAIVIGLAAYVVMGLLHAYLDGSYGRRVLYEYAGISLAALAAVLLLA